MLSKKLGGRLLQQYCSHSYKEELSLHKLRGDIYNIDDLYSIIDSDYSFNSIVTWSNKDHVHAFMHPRKEFHKQFGEHIIKKLNGN